MDRLHRATPSISITLCENEIRELIDLLDNQRSQSPVSNSLSYKMRLALDRLELAALRIQHALSEARKPEERS